MTDKLLEALRATVPSPPSWPSYEDYVLSQPSDPEPVSKPPQIFSKPIMDHRGNSAVPSRARYLAYLSEEIAGTKLSVHDVAGRGRRKEYTVPRWRAWRRLRAEGFSYPGIGRVAERNHGSVITGLRSLAKLEASPIGEAGR